MWKWTGLIMLFALFAGDALAAQAIAERANAHLAITISGPAIVRSGDGIKIDVTLSNSTTVPIGLAITPGSAELSDNGFEVQGPNGIPPKATYGLALEGKADMGSNEAASNVSRRQATVNPGEELQLSSVISNIYDMTAPGKYIIEARRYLPDGTIIKSNEIAVTVEKATGTPSSALSPK